MSRPDFPYRDFRYPDFRYRAAEPSHVAPYGALCNTQPTARLITRAAGRPSTPMPDLKLIALDAEDLGVISAHLQDAVLRVGDMVYLPKRETLRCAGQSLRLGESKECRRKRAEDILRQP